MQPRNPWICLTIVLAISLLGIVATVGLALDADNRALPSLAAGALGALSAFLVNIPRNSVGFPPEPPPPQTDKEKAP